MHIWVRWSFVKSEAQIAQSDCLVMQLETPLSGVELAAQIAKKKMVLGCAKSCSSADFIGRIIEFD